MLSVTIAHASYSSTETPCKRELRIYGGLSSSFYIRCAGVPAVLPTLLAPSLCQQPFGPLIVSDISAVRTEGLWRAPYAIHLSHLASLPEKGPYFLSRTSPSRESLAKRRVKWHPARVPLRRQIRGSPGFGIIITGQVCIHYLSSVYTIVLHTTYS
jgi:hypothetical protein